MARPVKHSREIRRRIRAAVAAYAYEFENDPIMSDAEFDALCAEIDPDVLTGNHQLDLFFLIEFEPDTGQWVHKHPELRKLKHIYDTHWKGRST